MTTAESALLFLVVLLSAGQFLVMASIRRVARHEAREEAKALARVVGRRLELLEKRRTAAPAPYPTLRFFEIDDEVS
jgi:hypothetical protein